MNLGGEIHAWLQPLFLLRRYVLIILSPQSSGCMSVGLEFMTKLEEWLFSSCLVISVCMCFIRLYLFG